MTPEEIATIKRLKKEWDEERMQKMDELDQKIKKSIMNL